MNKWQAAVDNRLMLISDRLKEVNKEVEELEWSPSSVGPDKLQALYLECKHLRDLLQKGDSYVPLF